MGTVSERDRVLLRRWADEHMDGQTADAFMNSTAPAGWDDFATKSDVAAVKSDIAAVRADIERNRVATEHAITQWRQAHEKSIEQWRVANEKAMEDLGARLTAMFTAQLATEIGKVHEQFARVYEKIGDLGRAQRSQTVALIITILVAFFGQAALPHFLPAPTPPAPIVIELSGE